MSEGGKRLVSIGALPLRLPEERQEIEFAIAEPAIVRSVAWCLEKRLVMTRGEAQFDEVLTLFVEYIPGATQKKHRFLVMATGQQIGVPDGHALSFVGSAASSNSGRVAHVYEIRAVS